MSEFLAMGGYAAFVWPAFAVAGLVLGGLFVVSQQTLRRRQRELEALKALNPRGRRRQDAAR